MPTEVKQYPGYEWRAEGYEYAARSSRELDLPEPPTPDEFVAVVSVLTDDWQDETSVVDAAWCELDGPVSVKRILEILNYLAFVGHEKRTADSQLSYPGGFEPIGRQWKLVPARTGTLTKEDLAEIDKNMAEREADLPPLHDTAEERQEERDKETIERRAGAQARGDAEDLPVTEGGTGKGWEWADDLTWVKTPGDYHPRLKVQDPDKIYYFDGRNNGREGQCDCPFSEHHGFCKHQHRYNLRQAARQDWKRGGDVAVPATEPVPAHSPLLSAEEIDELWT